MSTKNFNFFHFFITLKCLKKHYLYACGFFSFSWCFLKQGRKCSSLSTIHIYVYFWAKLTPNPHPQSLFDLNVHLGYYKYALIRCVAVNFMWQKFRGKLHLAKFLWTLIETFIHVFRLSECFQHMLNFVTWNWPQDQLCVKLVSSNNKGELLFR